MRSEILTREEFLTIIQNRSIAEHALLNGHDKALRARILELETQLQNAGTGAMRAVYTRDMEAEKPK